ncbi:MAG: SDR family NAD(P)-dependent oxidoreductase [Halioglobus sp.]|nr:SDR family NAD(P)-dependent oxidoreductase [Halioglobus sp.]
MSGQKITALVTGASSGLGAEFCRQLAARCDVIIAVARRGERLLALAEELAGTVEMHCLEADLQSIEGVARTMEAIRQQGPVTILVNNAGFGALGHFDTLPIEGQRAMINLHIDTSVTLCRAAIPFMRECGGGSIINVSSLASFVSGEGRAVYGASKVFLNYYSQALQVELAGSGIEVQALCPGFTRTEFHDGMTKETFDPDRVPPQFWMTSEDVVSASLEALGSGQVLVVPSEASREVARRGLQQQLDSLQ